MKVLAWLLYFTCLLNKLGDSQSLADEVFVCLDQAEAGGEDVRFERALIHFGIGQGRQNLNRKREALQSALEIFRQVGETWWVARVLMYLSISQNRMGLYAQAVQGLEESITLWRQVGDRDGLANSLRTLSFSYLHSRRLNNSVEIMEEAVENFYSLGTWNDIANADSLRGLVYLSLGRLAEGCAWLDKSLETFQKFGLGSREAFLHNVLGIGRLHLGDYVRVLFHARQAYTLAEEAGLRREMASARILLGCLHLVNDKTAAACQEFEDAVTIYRKMGYTQELDLALCYGGLALRRSGESDRAVEALCEALHLHQHSGSYTGAAAILPLAALLLLDRGDLEKAWQIWRLGAQHPMIGGSVWTREVARDLLQTRADFPHDGGNPAADPGNGTPGEVNKYIPELLAIFESHGG